MIADSSIEKIFDFIMRLSKADQTEALLFAGSSSLTRFANNRIHQNMNEEGVRLSIRAIVVGQTGSASTNDLSEDSIGRLVEAANKMAKISPKDPGFLTLPAPLAHTGSAPFSARTAAFSPFERAEGVKLMVERAKESSLVAAGAFAVQEAKIAVANSLGLIKTASLTDAKISTVFTSKSSSGYADAYGFAAEELSPGRLADQAAQKAWLSQDPAELAPGRYTVILEPAAVADMISHLAFCGFGALSFQEKRSFLNDRMGKRIVGPNVTVYDDALDDKTLGLPFDYEGVPKKRVVLIDKGVASGLVYDSYTATKDGVSSTGHGLPAPNPYGPQAQNLFLEGGDSSFAEMISRAKRAILVTRFHYTNIEDPLKTIMTGMTRDGTFLVEDGQIKQGIKNLRFTQSILEALSNVSSISAETELKETFLGCCTAPSLVVEDFNFTGKTEF
ncbi:MAG: TldD/PmbA family protein [Actinomycetota bacterium]|nr:TldD/PmbA family protein [Actinomycetota bacterium]